MDSTGHLCELTETALPHHGHEMGIGQSASHKGGHQMTTSLQKSHISAQAESVKQHTVYICIHLYTLFNIITFCAIIFTCKQLKIIYS